MSDINEYCWYCLQFYLFVVFLWTRIMKVAQVSLSQVPAITFMIVPFDGLAINYQIHQKEALPPWPAELPLLRQGETYRKELKREV